MKELLRMVGITKQFPGVLALDEVDLELYEGEVLALLGENGAGKSTLLKILSGVYQPNKGEFFIKGRKQNYKNPIGAFRAGVSIIYQELNYFPDLSVAENIYMGRIPKSSPVSVDWTKLYVNAGAVLKKLNVDINPRTLVKDLSTAEKQLVEIARALSFEDIKILVMDEPTAALNEKEVDALLKLVRQIAANGMGVIFISHRIDELFRVADRVQVLRDGRRITSVSMKDTSRGELVKSMVGRTISEMYPKEELKLGQIILEVSHLKNQKLKDISFHVRSGEILGVFGLMGAGRTEMCKAIFGASRLECGEIKVNGRPVKINTPSDAMAGGIAYVPNERKTEGLILCENVRENLSTARIRHFTKAMGTILDLKREKQNALKWKKDLSISTPGIDTIVSSLSGGNQQKVVLGKWLETKPKVIILNEPTRGIDIGAKVEIYKIMERLCREGMAVILVSSEQTEILALTDRTIVFYEGRLIGELTRQEYSQEKLMQLAIGGEA